MGAFQSRLSKVNAENKDLWRIHLGLLLAELICVPAFVFEISRALAGNTLSWAYVVEWPILGIYAIFMWRRLLQDVRGAVRKKSRFFRGRHLDEDPEAADPALEAWNSYLASVHEPTKDSRA
jgi:hypothetical protein